MDSRITDYVERVRKICASALSPNATLQRVREAASEFAAKPATLDEVERFVPEDGYGRNLLYRDPSSGFVVAAMVWPPGSGGLPHDHGIWGVVAVSQGVLRVTTFDREDDGSDPGHARLVQRSSIDAGPGAVAGVLPPHDDYHQVQNLTDELAISIHTYGADIESCHAFDVERQTCELLHPVWTKRPELQARPGT